MTGFEKGEVKPEVVLELRQCASGGADIPELVECLMQRLSMKQESALFPVLIYFRVAFDLTLREVLPLREWLGGKDRSEVDSLLIPAMERSKPRWEQRVIQVVT